MYADQILKGGRKTPMIELISCRGVNLRLRIRSLASYVSSHFQLSIKRLPFKKQSKSKLFEKENNVNLLSGNSKRVDILRIEICSEKMNTLLEHRLICAADVRFLDRKSKQCLQTLCLNTCLHNPTYSNPDFQLLDELNIADSPIFNRKTMTENLDKRLLLIS